jgi:two-component system, LytTR family, sensor kinase
MYISSYRGESYVTYWSDMIFGLLAITSTHIARTRWYKPLYNQYTIDKLLPKIIFAIALQAFVIGIIYYYTLYLLYNKAYIVHSHGAYIGIFFSSFLLLSIWHLIYYIIKFIQRNRNLIIERLQMENNLKNLQLNSIKNNLQPHFIFNALNSIRALVSEDPARARESITQLSNILRSSIMAEKNITQPLATEISLVKDYLSLEAIRYEHRLQYTIDVQAGTEQLPVPPLMLQTLVENAIKHGIAAQSQGGTLSITTQLHPTYYIIQMINTGQYTPYAQLPTSTGFGLHSSRERLQHVFGTSASLTISNINNTQVQLLINIPLLKNTNDD